jgi:hypothetical protein
MATGSPYQRPSSDDEIGMGKPQLTQTVSNAYTISPELFEKVRLSSQLTLVASRWMNRGVGSQEVVRGHNPFFTDNDIC